MKRKRDSALTRAAILEAAAAQFARRGYSGTTVEGIARQARVNKAMISYHFGGKRKLHTAILTETFAAARGRMAEIRDHSVPADERLRRFIRLFGELAARRPYFPTMMIREAISGGRNLDPKVVPHLLDVFGAVREVIEAGIKDGSFRQVDPVVTHVGLVGTLVFFFSTDEFRGRLLSRRNSPIPPIRTEEFLRHVQDWATRGLAAVSPSAPVVVCEPPPSAH